jgi:hypothetical protein
MDNYFLRPNAIKRIAEGYVTADNEINIISEFQRIQFRTLICKMFDSLSHTVHFDFTKDDPYNYESIQEVLPDFNKGRIKVNVSGNDSELWGPVYNLMFRAIHDYIHARYKFEFTVEDEVKAYYEQIGLSKDYLTGTSADWIMYTKVLKSEIIYQACVKQHFGKFHLDEQKIILSEL